MIAAKKVGYDYVTQLRDGSVIITPHQILPRELLDRTAFDAMMADASRHNAVMLPRARGMTKVVYFVGTTCTVKIGYATDLCNRFSKLQTTSPIPLRLLGAMPGTMEDERALHERFVEQRTRGEWFWRNAAIDSYIKEVSVL